MNRHWGFWMNVLDFFGLTTQREKDEQWLHLQRKIERVKINEHRLMISNADLRRSNDSLTMANGALRSENVNIAATVQPMIRGAETITHEGDGYNIVVTIAGDRRLNRHMVAKISAKAHTILASRFEPVPLIKQTGKDK